LPDSEKKGPVTSWPFFFACWRQPNYFAALESTMKNLHAAIFAIAICIAIPASAQAPKKQPPATRSSLDLLVSRIDSYWKFLAQKKKISASQYIAAADRDDFLNAAIPPFSDPRFKSLEVSADRKEATTTVVIKRVISPGVPAMEWPVIEQWRFEKGNWYRRFQSSTLPILEGAKIKRLSPEQEGDVKREIQQSLRFEKSVLDFGTVRESAPVQLSVKYTLAGNERMPIRYKLPRDFGIQGMSNNTLAPGQQELLLEVPTWNYEGAVEVPITLIAYRQGIEVPFEFTVKGTVYIPVSVSPKIFKLESAHPEQEILVRNNSKSDVELVRLHTETGKVSVEPLPAKVPAGQQIKLKAKFTARVSKSTRDSLAIPFAQPVDGMAVITITALFNAEEKGTAPDFLPADTSRNCKRPAD
jgi:hypothetical protein